MKKIIKIIAKSSTFGFQV